MPMGPEAILENAGCVWGTALRPEPPLKRPCVILVRLVGRRQIPLIFNRLNPVNGSTLRLTVVSTERIWSGASLFLDIPRASGGRPLGFNPYKEELGLSPGAWGAPFGGNDDGARGIFGNVGRFWATALHLDVH